MLGLILLAGAAAAAGLDGSWRTTYGEMSLAESSGTVRGGYDMGGQPGSIEGKVEGRRLVFEYTEPLASGEGWFELADDGKSFAGSWRQKGSTSWLPWKGVRSGQPPQGFDGLWQTSYGSMRLNAGPGGTVTGGYAWANGSLSGKSEGRTLKFRYKDVAEGEGEFTLSEDGRRFEGRWRADGEAGWKPWLGSRIAPMPGRRWLVVIESRWEAGLWEREYTYGEMLRGFFTRAPNVEVRHRQFTDKASLSKWLREVAYLAEPTVVYLSAHGSPQGVASDDGPIGADVIARELRHASNVRLLHFGACEVMNGEVPARVHAELAGAASFPISGFAQTVDWAASAITDFMYLDLILAREHPPETAARELAALIPYSTKKVKGGPFESVSFRFLPAPGGTGPVAEAR